MSRATGPMSVSPWSVARHGSAAIVSGEQRPFPCERRSIFAGGRVMALGLFPGFARWREAAQGIRLWARGVAPPPFCERLIFFASPNCRLFAGEYKGWRSLISGAASQRRHRQGFWRDRRVYSQDVGGGGLPGRSPLALTCFSNTGRRGALLSHVFFSRFFSRSLLESAPRRGAPHSSLCSQLRTALCSQLRSSQCRVPR